MTALGLTGEDLSTLPEVDPTEWRHELGAIDAHHTAFGSRLPQPSTTSPARSPTGSGPKP